jgi:hypothetical protein
LITFFLPFFLSFFLQVFIIGLHDPRHFHKIKIFLSDAFRTKKKKENVVNKKSCLIKTNRKNQNVVWWRITFRPIQGLAKQGSQAKKL